MAWLPRTLAEDDILSGQFVDTGDPGWEVPIEIRLFWPVARQSRAAWVALGRL